MLLTKLKCLAINTMVLVRGPGNHDFEKDLLSGVSSAPVLGGMST